MTDTPYSFPPGRSRSRRARRLARCAHMFGRIPIERAPASPVPRIRSSYLISYHQCLSNVARPSQTDTSTCPVLTRLHRTLYTIRVSCLRMLNCHLRHPSCTLHMVSHCPSTAPTARTHHCCGRAAAAMCAAMPPRARPCRWRRGPWCGAAQRAIRPLVTCSAHVVQCQEVGIGRVRGPRVEWREPRPSAVAAAFPPRPRQGALGRAIRSAQEALANV